MGVLLSVPSIFSRGACDDSTEACAWKVDGLWIWTGLSAGEGAETKRGAREGKGRRVEISEACSGASL